MESYVGGRIVVTDCNVIFDTEKNKRRDGRVDPWCGWTTVNFAFTAGDMLLLPYPFHMIPLLRMQRVSLTVIALLFLGGCSDPGIVLPARTDTPPIKEQRIDIQGVGHVTLEVCHSCRVLRPPRSSHCGLQGVCVREYDHYLRRPVVHGQDAQGRARAQEVPARRGRPQLLAVSRQALRLHAALAPVQRHGLCR
jgi:hypothetical protein